MTVAPSTRSLPAEVAEDDLDGLHPVPEPVDGDRTAVDGEESGSDITYDLASPGAIPPARALDWSKGVGTWGPKNPLVRPKPWGAPDLGWSVLWLIAAAVIPSVIGAALAVAALSSTASQSEVEAALLALTKSAPFLLVSLLALWGVFLGYPAYATYRKGARSFRSDYGLRFDLPRDIIAGIALAMGLRLAETGILTGLDAIGVDLSQADNSSFLNDPTRLWIGTALLALATSLGAPFTEEVFFRGFALRAIQRSETLNKVRWFGRNPATLVAIVGSSLMFGSMHATSAGTGGLILIGVTGTLGLVFALVAVKSGRLGIPITAHIAFNTSAVVLVLAPSLQPYAPWAFIVIGAVAAFVWWATRTRPVSDDAATATN